MKKMMKTRIVRFSWERVDKKDVDPEHELGLRRVAEANIIAGYFGPVPGGEMEMFFQDEKHPEKSIAYKGWWSLSEFKDSVTEETGESVHVECGQWNGRDSYELDAGFPVVKVLGAPGLFVDMGDIELPKQVPG